jgi:hypothetical protein
MGGNAWERHGLFRFGAFVAARVRRPPQYQNAKSALHCGRIKRIIKRCNNRTQERRAEARRGGRVAGIGAIPSDTATYEASYSGIFIPCRIVIADRACPQSAAASAGRRACRV